MGRASPTQSASQRYRVHSANLGQDPTASGEAASMTKTPNSVTERQDRASKGAYRAGSLSAYQNQLRLDKPGDEPSDWELAKKIVCSPMRTTLFASNHFFNQAQKPYKASFVGFLSLTSHVCSRIAGVADSGYESGAKHIYDLFRILQIHTSI